MKLLHLAVAISPFETLAAAPVAKELDKLPDERYELKIVCTGDGPLVFKLPQRLLWVIDIGGPSIELHALGLLTSHTLKQ